MQSRLQDPQPSCKPPCAPPTATRRDPDPGCDRSSSSRTAVPHASQAPSGTEVSAKKHIPHLGFSAFGDLLVGPFSQCVFGRDATGLSSLPRRDESCGSRSLEWRRTEQQYRITSARVRRSASTLSAQLYRSPSLPERGCTGYRGRQRCLVQTATHRDVERPAEALQDPRDIADPAPPP